MAPFTPQSNPSNPRRDTDSRASTRGAARHVPAQEASSRGPDPSTTSQVELVQGRRNGTNDVGNPIPAQLPNASGGTTAPLPPSTPPFSGHTRASVPTSASTSPAPSSAASTTPTTPSTSPPPPTTPNNAPPRLSKRGTTPPHTKPATHLAKTNNGITTIRQMTAKNKHLATTNLDAVSKQRAAAQQTAADLAARNRDVDALKDELGQLKRDRTELEKQLKLVREGLDKQLRVLTAEKDGLVRKVGELGSEKDALERKAAGLGGEKEKLEKRVKGLEGDKEGLTRQVGELEVENGKWAEMYELLVESLDEPGQALVEISQQLVESNALLEKLLGVTGVGA